MNKTNKTTAPVPTEEWVLATCVRFDGEHFHITLEDGRVVVAPATASQRLREATQEQRAHFRLIGGGHGIEWPDIDEHLRVGRLLELYGTQS